MPSKQQLAAQRARQHMRNEYAKCFVDPLYFIKTYVKIQHQDRGIIPFATYPFQEDCFKKFHDHGRCVVLKSRQMGISTLVSAYALWELLFHEGKNILVISTKETAAKEIIAKIKLANDNLPPWLKIPELESNKLSLKLNNQSRVLATSSASDSARGFAASLLIIDEAAFIEGIEEIWTSAQQTLATVAAGKAIILSTPNGMGNFFHRVWSDAETQKNNFKTVKIHWSLHPERDQTWRDAQTKELGARMAGQECDCDFLASGNNVVDLIKLKEIEDAFVIDPIEISEGGALWVWERAKSGTDYLVTADVATGDGSDYSAFHVIDRDTMIQVAEYQDKIGILEFARILVSVATRYNNAQLVVERESYGRAVLEFILEDGYRNLIFTNSNELYVEVKGKIRNKYYAEEKKLLPGFSTNEKTRILIIGKIELYLNQKYFTPRSVRLVNELKTFIWHNGRAEAANGYHDDLVISLGIGLWIRDNSLRWKEENMELTKKMLQNINTPDKPDNHSPIYTAKSAQNSAFDQWNMRIGRGDHERENLSWLL